MGRIVYEGNSVYEIDTEYLLKKRTLKAENRSNPGGKKTDRSCQEHKKKRT